MQAAALAVAADHGRLQPAGVPGCHVFDREEAEAGRRPHPGILDQRRFANEPARPLVEESVAHARCLRELGRQVERLARRPKLKPDFAPGHDLAGAQADPELEPHRAVALQLRSQIRESLRNLGRGSHCAERIVLVDGRQSEDGRDRIAGHSLDRPSVTIDRGLDVTEDAAADTSKGLRVEARAGHGRRRCEPDMDDGDGLSKLARNRLRGRLERGWARGRLGFGALLGREIEAGS